MNIIHRKEAVKLGQREYFTGKPCKNGHISKRYTQSGTCAACINAASVSVKEALVATTTTTGAKRTRRQVLDELVEVRVRCYMGPDYVTLRTVALAYSRGVCPELELSDIAGRGTPTSLASGTAAYKLRIPAEYTQAMYDTAEALLNTHPVDFSHIHHHVVTQAQAIAVAERPPIPEWTFK